MKKTLFVLLMTLVLLSGNIVSVFADTIIDTTTPADYYVYVTTPDGGLNMRSNHNGSSTKVFEGIPDGTRLYIGSTYNNTWGYTSYNGYEGWVYLPQTTREKEAGYNVYVAAPDGGLNMRQAPGGIYKLVLKGIPNDTELYIDFVAGDWGHTVYNNYVGWVYLPETSKNPPVTPSANQPSQSFSKEVKTDTEIEKPEPKTDERAEEKKAVEQNLFNQITLIAILVMLVIVIAVLMIIIINMKSKRK